MSRALAALGLLAAAVLLPAAAGAQIQLVPGAAPTQVSPSPPPRGEPHTGARREGQPPQTEEERRRRAEERRRQQQQQQNAQPQQAATPPPPNNPFPRRLDQREIRTRFFDGQPVNARGLGGATFVVRFHADGRMERTAPNGQVTNGRWRMLGDGYCSRWEGSAEQCYTVVQDGATVRVVRGTRGVATWTR